MTILVLGMKPTTSVAKSCGATLTAGRGPIGKVRPIQRYKIATTFDSDTLLEMVSWTRSKSNSIEDGRQVVAFRANR